MLVLGIESSCDEMACAIVENGQKILSNVVASQMDLHARFGGVVPELACRQHIDLCLPVLDQALKEAKISTKDIDLIAVTKGPGLIGALLIGVNFAKGLSFGLEKPLVGINHIEAHLYSVMMGSNVPLPSLGVVISGGHTALLVIHDVGNYQLIGQTQDDAIGEAFDKVAALLGLPYPGGPLIEALAKEGNPDRYALKAGQIKNRPFDFSFSGLKTGVLYLVKGQNGNKTTPLKISEEEKKDVAASFQKAAFSDLILKSLNAAKSHQCRSILLGGGVSNNMALREMYQTLSPIPIFWPPRGLSLDNAAMIAGLGYLKFLQNEHSDSLSLDVLPRIPL